MAELSTIARPYAQGLWKALVARNNITQAQQLLDALDAISTVTAQPDMVELVNDPKVSDEQMLALLTSAIGQDMPAELAGLLRTVIENGRLCALAEIAAQFRALKNESEGVADAYIESAFELSQDEVKSLLIALANKFPGLTLNPIVTINKDLIGGVCVRVGDKVLDGSVRARLASMQAALTA